MRRVTSLSVTVLLLVALAGMLALRAQGSPRKTIATEADFRQAMKDLSNWNRWGADDELGASNLITPAKRKQAAALVKEGITVSMAHDIVEEAGPEGPTKLDRVVVSQSPTGAADRYQFTGTYHGIIISHLDSVNCHVLFEGKGYNGRSWEDIKPANGCPKGNINAQKDGIITRGVLFDATLLPGKANAQGWLDPGTAIHREDLEALEKIQRVKVSPGDVILLHTGRWQRRAALGAWKPQEGYAGFHADVAFFLKERGVSFIGGDAYNDVGPSGVPGVGLPLHSLALVSLGVSIFDNLDLGRVAETARRLKRWEFLFTAAPLRIDKGMGSPLNPIATF